MNRVAVVVPGLGSAFGQGENKGSMLGPQMLAEAVEVSVNLVNPAT